MIVTIIFYIILPLILRRISFPTLSHFIIVMSSMRPLICIIVLYLTTSGSVWSLLIGKFSRSTSLFQSQRSLRPVTNFRSSKALALSSEKAESILTLNEMTVNNKKTYCTCVSCKCAYWVTADQLGPTGRTKVLCKLCKSSWFQSVDKLMDVGDEHLLVPLPDDRIEQVRRCVVDKKVFRYWPKDKVSLFVGNLPMEYTEKELGELIAEYGIFQLQVIKDREGSSRGFAFVDVSPFLPWYFCVGCGRHCATPITYCIRYSHYLQLFTQEDADQMAREMNGFYIASDKALFVRPVRYIRCSISLASFRRATASVPHHSGVND